MERTLFVITLTLLLSPCVSRASNDIYITICNDTKYINCIGTSTDECISANTRAVNTCTEKYPHLTDRDEEELQIIATKYAKCTNEHYFSNLGIDSDKFEKCAIYLEPIFDKKYYDALKKYSEH